MLRDWEKGDMFAGPELPSHLLSQVSHDVETAESCVIGPEVPVSDSPSSSIAKEFEMRSLKMKEKLTRKTSEKPVRDKWMTEIPDQIGSGFGLPVVKSKFGDGKQKIDRAGWERTPQENPEEPMTSQDNDLSLKLFEEHDRATGSSVEALNKRSRQDSLLELHQKRLKKEKKKKNKKEKKERKAKKKKDRKESKPKKSERRPFDRDRDIQVNVFDDAKKKTLIKRSQQLTSRFTNSTIQGQFL